MARARRDRSIEWRPTPRLALYPRRRLTNPEVAEAVAGIVTAQLPACLAAQPALLDSLLLRLR